MGYIKESDNTVGIDDLETLQLKVFPNPTTGKINVQGIQADRIEVIDLQGRILSVKNHPGPVVDISNLPDGLYFLRLMVKDKVIVEQVVKE